MKIKKAINSVGQTWGKQGAFTQGKVAKKTAWGRAPAGWAGPSRLQRSPSRANGALPDCHLVVPTQTVVAARGPGRNSIPWLLLFTGVV